MDQQQVFDDTAEPPAPDAPPDGGERLPRADVEPSMNRLAVVACEPMLPFSDDILGASPSLFQGIPSGLILDSFWICSFQKAGLQVRMASRAAGCDYFTRFKLKSARRRLPLPSRGWNLRPDRADRDESSERWLARSPVGRCHRCVGGFLCLTGTPWPA